MLGTTTTVLSEHFDGVTAPALPAGWTTSFTNGDGDCTVGGATCALGSNWTTVTTNSPPSGPNAAFHNNPSCVTDNSLVSPALNITTSSAQVSFKNAFSLENTFDGGVLEVSSPNINAGAFTDITDAAVGGSFVSGGYTGTISGVFLSPIANRKAWTGTSGGSSSSPSYLTSIANLGPNVVGQTIKLRWRVASDCSVSATGQWIDDVLVTDGTVCSTPCLTCVVTCPANITQANDPNQCGAVVNYPAPTTTGSCGTVTCSPASGSFFAAGSTTVTCTSTSGPSCSFSVKVQDTQPSTITCPGGMTKFTDPGQFTAKVNPGTPVASDNCSTVSVTGVRSDGKPLSAPYPLGVTVITWTAKDGAGNTDSCSQTIVVLVPSGQRRHPN
jgi:HYR domain-containing protein